DGSPGIRSRSPNRSRLGTAGAGCAADGAGSGGAAWGGLAEGAGLTGAGLGLVGAPARSASRSMLSSTSGLAAGAGAGAGGRGPAPSAGTLTGALQVGHLRVWPAAASGALTRDWHDGHCSEIGMVAPRRR